MRRSRDGRSLITSASAAAREKVVSLQVRIRRYLDDGRRGEIIRSGIHLAIVGPPNAGKSSLLNWLGTRSLSPSFRSCSRRYQLTSVSLQLDEKQRS